MGIPPKEYLGDVDMYSGIKTGYNKAFLINEIEREELLSADYLSIEIIKPYVKGDDIRKFRITAKKHFIIFTKMNIEIDKFPAIFSNE